jgi:hypothetical protein
MKIDIDVIDKLEMLDKEDLSTVILWTLKDLENWGEAEGVRDGIPGFASMLHEAIEYQLSKAVDKHNRTEEQ